MLRNLLIAWLVKKRRSRIATSVKTKTRQTRSFFSAIRSCICIMTILIFAIIHTKAKKYSYPIDMQNIPIANKPDCKIIFVTTDKYHADPLEKKAVYNNIASQKPHSNNTSNITSAQSQAEKELQMIKEIQKQGNSKPYTKTKTAPNEIKTRAHKANTVLNSPKQHASPFDIIDNIKVSIVFGNFNSKVEAERKRITLQKRYATTLANRKIDISIIAFKGKNTYKVHLLNRIPISEATEICGYLKQKREVCYSE